MSLRVEWLLTQVAADDPRRRSLEIVEQEVERMGNLVANLLQFSRRGQRQISSVNVSEELVKSLELIQDHLRNRRIQVLMLVSAKRTASTEAIPGSGMIAAFGRAERVNASGVGSAR